MKKHIACQPKIINRNSVNSDTYRIDDLKVLIFKLCKLEKLRIRYWNFSKKIILHTWHTAHRANMAPFGGYDMPLWFASAKNEHIAVLTSAGLFDTSHMAVISVKGLDSFELLQHCFTKPFIGDQILLKNIHPHRTARQPINEML